MHTKKNNYKILIGTLAILILGSILLITNNKTKYFKQLTNTTFDTLIKTATNIQNFPIIGKDYNDITLDLKDNKNPSESLKLTLNLDNTNNYLKLNGLLTNANKELFNGNFNYQNNKTYFNIANLTNGNYAFAYDLTECTEEKCADSKYYLSDLIANSLTNSRVSNDDLKKILESLKKITASSFENRYVDKRKITTNNNTYVRYSYPLNGNSLNKLLTKIDKNSSLKSSIFTLFGSALNELGITQDNFKDILQDIDDNFGTLTLIVSQGKITKIALNIINGLAINITPTDTAINTQFTSSSGNDGIIIYNKTTNVYTFKLFNKYSNSLELEIRPENTKVTINYSVSDDKNKASGTITNPISADNDTFSGTLNLKNSYMNLDVAYKFANNNVDIPLITDSQDFADLTTANQEKIINQCEESIDTSLINNILKSFQEFASLLNSEQNISVEEISLENLPD